MLINVDYNFPKFLYNRIDKKKMTETLTIMTLEVNISESVNICLFAKNKYINK